MSLLSKAFKAVKGVISSPVVRALAPVVGGPIGVGISTLGTAYGAYKALKPAAGPSMPGVGQIMPQGMTMGGMQFGAGMPALGAVGGTLVRAGAAGARRIYSSAANYCRKHPGWCQTIGGIAAVEALIQSGQLPPTKTRRGRGITATELKNFRRVARFTSKYCAPVRRAMSSKAVRRGASCR